MSVPKTEAQRIKARARWRRYYYRKLRFAPVYLAKEILRHKKQWETDKHNQDYRAKRRERALQYRQQYRVQCQAYNKVSTAVKCGKLIPLPCVKCGNVKVHAHHPDYSKPLKVIWLCSLHHQELHRNLRRTTK